MKGKTPQILYKAINAHRRSRVKKYLAGKKKNMFGVMKNKKDVISARKEHVKKIDAVKSVFNRDVLINVNSKLRQVRKEVKAKGAKTMARNKVMKNMKSGKVYA